MPGLAGGMMSINGCYELRLRSEFDQNYPTVWESVMWLETTDFFGSNWDLEPIGNVS